MANTTNHSGLKRGGPGRPKGAKNKVTLERNALEEFSAYFNSAEYVANARARIAAGRAPHLEAYWLPKFYGKDVTEVKGTLVFKWQQ